MGRKTMPGPNPPSNHALKFRGCVARKFRRNVGQDGTDIKVLATKPTFDICTPEESMLGEFIPVTYPALPSISWHAPNEVLQYVVASSYPLPGDLHYLIIDEVICTGDQQTLVACALTCREWLRRIGPFLFRTITLNHQEQLSRLLISLCSPFSCIKNHTRAVHIRQTHDDLPWGHTAITSLAGVLPAIEELQYTSLEHWPEGGNVVFSQTFPPHHTMPKMLPALLASFRSLAKLRLDTYRFQSFTDMLRIAGAIETLQSLEMEELSWSHLPESLPPLLRTGCHLFEAKTTECRDVWPMFWLWAAPLHPNGRGRDFPGLSELAANTLADICRRGNSRMMTETAGFNCVRVSDDHWLLDIHDVYGRESLEAHVIGNAGSGSIDKIVFKDIALSSLQSAYNWQEVDGLLSRLPALNTILIDVLGFDSTSPDDPLAELRAALPLSGHLVRSDSIDRSIQTSS